MTKKIQELQKSNRLEAYKFYDFNEPLTITFARAKSEGACDVSYRKMGKHLGGITKYGRNTPVTIETILEVCGFWDAVWALIAINAERPLSLFAADCAERVLPIYEKQYPEDQRPRQAIEAARAFARGEISAAARADARVAALAAAEDAAGGAALAAARASALAAERASARAAALAAAEDAAGGAEREWQKERLREYLRGER